ncbi:ABC transporter permease, partial [Bifidobacteriaceae bacterium WP022]
MTQSRFKRMLIKYLPTVFSVIVLLVFWQYACEYYKISENLIPTPSSIVQSTADALPTL